MSTRQQLRRRPRRPVDPSSRLSHSGRAMSPWRVSSVPRAFYRADVASWDPATDGVLALPSKRLVRGRSLRTATPVGPTPDRGLYLLRTQPPEVGWASRWVRWTDFWLPADPADLTAALYELLDRAADERVEIACRGGTGRTGTALACLAVLDGVPNADAVDYVRQRYARGAVETRWQRAFVARFDRR